MSNEAETRQITFIFPHTAPDRYKVGEKTQYGTVSKIWISHDPRDLFARVTTEKLSVVFKGVPFVLSEEVRE